MFVGARNLSRAIARRLTMYRMIRLLLVLLAAMLSGPLLAQSPAPDVIFKGQFLTLDPAHPHVEAIAVSKGRIIAVGSQSEVETLANTATTKIITFSGVALPGFGDAHL